jgi:hypothetical protein
MSDEEREILIEQAASAFRERNPWGRILPAAAWHDLAPQDREAAFERQLANRVIERALDPEGWSATVRAVLARLREER